MILLTLGDIFQRFVQKPSKRRYTMPNDEEHVYKKWRTAFLTVGSVYLKHRTQNPKSNAASDNQRSPNMTLHLNKKHVLLQVERSEEVPITDFFVTTKEESKAELKQTILKRTQRRFGMFVFSFWWNSPIIFGWCLRKSTNQLHTIQNDEDHVSKNSNAVFINIRYRKTSQKQEVNSQSTKRSLRSLGQPKSDSRFEQKTRIVPSREIWVSCQNSFFSYKRRKKPTRALKDIFGTYSTSFWKNSVLLKKQKLFL